MGDALELFGGGSSRARRREAVARQERQATQADLDLFSVMSTGKQEMMKSALRTGTGVRVRLAAELFVGFLFVAVGLFFLFWLIEEWREGRRISQKFGLPEAFEAEARRHQKYQAIKQLRDTAQTARRERDRRSM